MARLHDVFQSRNKIPDGCCHQTEFSVVIYKLFHISLSVHVFVVCKCDAVVKHSSLLVDPQVLNKNMYGRIFGISN